MWQVDLVTVDLVAIDLMRVDLVAIDLVRIDLVTPSQTNYDVIYQSPSLALFQEGYVQQHVFSAISLCQFPQYICGTPG